MKANDVVGKWTLRSRLGRGGNGEVWRADDAHGAEAAVKILRRRNRIDRFRDEIQFLREHGGVEGVLPLIDSDLPDDPSQAAWYAMPVARPLRDALGEDPAPRALHR